MKFLIIYSVVITILFFIAIGHIIYHRAVEDQNILQQNSDLFTDKIKAENHVTDLTFQIDTLKKHYENIEAGSVKTDTFYIKIKQRIPALTADSTCKLLSNIYTEIDSVFRGYYNYDIKP